MAAFEAVDDARVAVGEDDIGDAGHLSGSAVIAPRAVAEVRQDRGIAVQINRPFMNGTYFDAVANRPLPEWTREFDCESWAQFSLKYVLAHPAVTCVLTETSNPVHMEENIHAAFGRLPDETARRRMRELIASL